MSHLGYNVAVKMAEIGLLISVLIILVLVAVLAYYLAVGFFSIYRCVASSLDSYWKSRALKRHLRERRAAEDELQAFEVGTDSLRHSCQCQCGKNVPERMIEGSDLKDWLQPDFQCSIFTQSRTGQPIRMGEGFRANIREVQGKGTKTINVLVTAAHVIQHAIEGKIILVKDVLNSGTVERKNLEVSLEDFIVAETEDVAFYRFRDEQLSRFPLKGCRLTEVTLNTQQIANVGGANKGSLGVVQPFEKAFGMVQFDGSTVRGTSGAPYHLNNAVYGLHVGCTSNNVGYSAPYVLALARLALFVKREDTEQYLLDQCIKKGKKFRYKMVGISDLWAIEIGSRVYTVDEDFVDQLLKDGGKGENTRYEPNYEREGLEIAPRLVEDAPEGFLGYVDSGNFLGAEANVVASAPGNIGQTQATFNRESTQGKASVLSRSTPTATEIQKSGSQGTGTQEHMGFPELTPAPRAQVSEDTLQLIEQLRKGLNTGSLQVGTLSKNQQKSLKSLAGLFRPSGLSGAGLQRI